METFTLVIMLFISPGTAAKVEAPFDTRDDCEMASAIIGTFPKVLSTECYTVTVGEEGEPISYGYNIEQGV